MHERTVVIHGGTIVNAGSATEATVVVSGGTVAALLRPDAPLPDGIDEVIDATGLLVLPGGVDPHCHVATQIGPFMTLDDYEQASVAALHGGTTTIVDFAIPGLGERPLQALVRRRRLAEQARCGVAFHGCITSWDEDTPAEIEEMTRLGCRSVKLFTTYRGDVMVNSEVIVKVMRKLKELNGLAYIHAEADHLVVDSQERQAAIGQISARFHAETRPGLAEISSVSEVLAIARYLDAPVYFVHQSLSQVSDLVEAARVDGVPAFSETCPHYVILDDGVYRGDQPQLYVCCPPLRARDEVRALATRLRDRIHTVGSDHNCFDSAQKEQSRDVRSMPNGLPGVELRIPLLFSEFVRSGSITPQRLVELTSTNPAKLNGLYPRKGLIAVGSDADVVLFDPNASKIIEPAALHMASDYSPYEKLEVFGWPTRVLVGGTTVIADDRYIDPGPMGAPLTSAPIPFNALD